MRRDLQYRLTADWTSVHYPNWQRWLGHLVGEPGVQMAEIGSYEGRSAMWFAENVLTGAGAQLHCIDVWADSRVEKNFLYNLRKFSLSDRVKVDKGTSDEWMEWGSPFFDAIYIDGDHSTEWVARDAENAWAVLRPGGVLIFDDYYFDSVKVAVDDFLARKVTEVESWEDSRLGETAWQVMVRKEVGTFDAKP